MFSRMNNRDTLSPDELVKFFLSRQKRADLNKTEEDTPNGLMQEDIIVEPLEDQESEDTLDFLQRMIMSQSGKVAEAKETLGEQLADIKEKALANIDNIKNTQLKSGPNPFIGGPLSPMLTEEGVEQEVEKIVDPMLRDPKILDIPPKLFDESAQQTEEALTVEEVSDIASDAIDAAPDADEVQPTDGKVIDLNKELDAILIAEGGYQNDKDDSGNYVNGVLIGTNRGVTPAALAKHRGVKVSSITVEDIKNVTEQEARDIFKEEYFYKPKLDKLPMDLQASVFDMQINSGSNAIKILQKLVGTKQDGIIGPKTLKALEDNPVSVNEYADARIEYYNKVVTKSPEKKKFLSGWTSRANSYKV